MTEREKPPLKPEDFLDLSGEIFTSSMPEAASRAYIHWALAATERKNGWREKAQKANLAFKKATGFPLLSLFESRRQVKNNCLS